jgi:hypothetical protein
MGSFSGIVLVVLHSTRKPVMSSILSHVVHFEVESTTFCIGKGDALYIGKGDVLARGTYWQGGRPLHWHFLSFPFHGILPPVPSTSLYPSAPKFQLTACSRQATIEL